MRHDPSAPGVQDAEDDTQLSVESLQEAKPDGIVPRLLERVTRALQSRPDLARKLSLGVLGVLLLAIGLTVWQPPVGAPVSAALSTATPSGRSSVVSSLQVQTPVLQPGDGWIPAGPSEAQHIVFAPSNPAIAYTCGAPGFSSMTNPVSIAVEVSYDHGNTWQLSKTPALGVVCDITVDPTDAADVTLAAITESPDRTATPAAITPSALELYRSLNGGENWRPWPLPTSAEGRTARFTWTSWAWAGATLFAAPYAAGERGYTRLAASVQRKPFAWVQQNGLFAGAPSDAGINDLFGTQTTLYVDLYSQSQCGGSGDNCRRIMWTHDNGASWSQFTGQFQGRRIYPLQFQASGGRSLFGVALDPTDPTGEARTYLRSEDDGVTWRPLVSPPQSLYIGQIVQVPDGTTYADLGPFPGADSVQPGIYALATSATSWRFVAPDPGGYESISVTWNEQGHALALWGGATLPGSNHPPVGLATHAP